MNKFLKLSTLVINKDYIYKIIIKPHIYNIYININVINGIMMFGSGYMDSKVEYYEFCEKKDPSDYKIITEWISKI